jgi:hypothetical protein
MHYLIRVVPLMGRLDIHTPGGDRLWKFVQPSLSFSNNKRQFHLADATGRQHGTVLLRDRDEYDFAIKPKAGIPVAAFRRTDDGGYIRFAGTPRISVFFDGDASVGTRAFQFTVGPENAGSLEESRRGPWSLSISRPRHASVLLLLGCAIVMSLAIETGLAAASG